MLKGGYFWTARFVFPKEMLPLILGSCLLANLVYHTMPVMPGFFIPSLY